MLGLAMLAALVLLGSNLKPAVAGKEAVKLSQKQSLVGMYDDDDEQEDDSLDTSQEVGDSEDDGEDADNAQDVQETQVATHPVTTLATGTGQADEDKDDKDDDDDDDKDDDTKSQDSKDEAEAEAEAEEKVPNPDGCSTNAKECLKACLGQNQVEGDKVESIMSGAKGYAECFINSCEDKQLPEGEKCSLTTREFDVCWESLEDLSAELMTATETCTVQVSGDKKLKIDKYLNKYATVFD
eukprot:CAMPEP_0202814822 /NCGR_PEP_ID=MMETSP1389-20130828/5858_1 /ASSEMBLY_ACC=CAM_ASM_000865 /TAXON_ID=302021 /ORGANISM="Rhodomonas sp., Strain CCMP768" /LENGTH=239 /DNA_ID=CAMNT_0049486667 /DNA_START=1 /DNA_END=720 /DNA_ORIENTATION=-